MMRIPRASVMLLARGCGPQHHPTVSQMFSTAARTGSASRFSQEPLIKTGTVGIRSRLMWGSVLLGGTTVGLWWATDRMAFLRKYIQDDYPGVAAFIDKPVEKTLWPFMLPEHERVPEPEQLPGWSGPPTMSIEEEEVEETPPPPQQGNVAAGIPQEEAEEEEQPEEAEGEEAVEGGEEEAAEGPVEGEKKEPTEGEEGDKDDKAELPPEEGFGAEEGKDSVEEITEEKKLPKEPKQYTDEELKEEMAEVIRMCDEMDEDTKMIFGISEIPDLLAKFEALPPDQKWGLGMITDEELRAATQKNVESLEGGMEPAKKEVSPPDADADAGAGAAGGAADDFAGEPPADDEFKGPGKPISALVRTIGTLAPSPAHVCVCVCACSG